MHDYIWALIVLLCLGYMYYRKKKLNSKVNEISFVLDDIINGNKNRRIQVSEQEQLAPFVFKVNKLIDAYQKDQIHLYKMEQARKEMMANLSHDVRTPLASVLGYLEALCEGLAKDEETEYLHIAKDKANNLKETIDQLFLMAQLDANEIQIRLERIELYEWLRQALIGWLPIFKKENITLEINIPDDLCNIDVDVQALSRILNNLIQNALKYGRHCIGINADIENEYAYFEVWDKGPGLHKDEIKKVFNRLYRGDTSRSSKGHGLGLAISKSLVEKMNGDISIDSKPHIKTSVKVSFLICKNL